MLRTAAAALALAALTPLAGCGGGSHGGSEAVVTGSVSMALETVSDGITCRLEHVAIFIEGNQFQFLSGEEPSESVLSTTLPTGSYSAFLQTFQLTRDDGRGNFEPVMATLVSSPSQSFSIYNGTMATFVFTSQTDGVIVTVGSGTLDVVGKVDSYELPFGGHEPKRRCR